MPNASKGVEKVSARCKEEKSTTPIYTVHTPYRYTHMYTLTRTDSYTDAHTLQTSRPPAPTQISSALGLLGAEPYCSIPRMPFCQWTQLSGQVVSPCNCSHLFYPSVTEWMDNTFHNTLNRLLALFKNTFLLGTEYTQYCSSYSFNQLFFSRQKVSYIYLLVQKHKKNIFPKHDHCPDSGSFSAW